MTARIEVLAEGEPPAFMSVRQVARYLQLNEKKIYALLKSGDIPGTKITGKWLFPRELIDRWVRDSAHGGLLHDRLIVCGGDDPLLHALFLQLGREHGARALIAYSPGGSRLGLDLLQNGRADVSVLHWGPDSEAETRHPALLRRYPQHRQWILLHLFRRQAGILLGPEIHPQTDGLEQLLDPSASLRWCLRQQGSGMQRFFEEALGQLPRKYPAPEPVVIALSERDAARQLALGTADCAPGCAATAAEHGLGFLPLGWESLDLVLPQSIYFRQLFQQMLEALHSNTFSRDAERLAGYDLEHCGRITWNGE